MQSRQQLRLMTRQAASGHELLRIGAVPGEASRQVVAARRRRGRRRDARLGFGALAERVEPRTHHSDRFMKAAQLRKRLVELRSQTLRLALVRAAPTNE